MTKASVISCDDCVITSSMNTENGNSKMRFISSCPAAYRVSKKYENRRKLQRKEYKNLKKVLPTLSRSPKASKRDIIEEAIKYIDYLHGEIANRFYTADGVFKPSKEDSPVADCVKKLLLFPDPIHCTIKSSHDTNTHQLQENHLGQFSNICHEQFFMKQQLLQQQQTVKKYSNTDIRLRI